MSTFFQERNNFIRTDMKARLGDGAIGVFVSQSTAPSEDFPSGSFLIAGISVPYTSGSYNFGSSLKDTTIVYLEYSVVSTNDEPLGGQYPYPFASGTLAASTSLYPYNFGDPRVSASGSKDWALRTIEIPIASVQARDTHYFFDPVEFIPVPVLLAEVGNLSYVPMRVSFGGPENFYKSDFNATINNYIDNRRSFKRIKVDRNTVSPSTGQYINTTVPANYPVVLQYIKTDVFLSGSTEISSSLGSFESLDVGAFASVQDSNYASSAWKNLRYDGVSEGNLNILGNEPALTFQEFDGATYEVSASAAAVKAILDADRDIVPIYYVNFNKGSELRGKNPGGSSTLPTFTYSAINIVTSPTANRFTIFYEEQDSSGRLIPLDSRKIYSIDRGVVYRTNEDGKVSGVE